MKIKILAAPSLEGLYLTQTIFDDYGVLILTSILMAIMAFYSHYRIDLVICIFTCID
jgi:hypothetical protein